MMMRGGDSTSDLLFRRHFPIAVSSMTAKIFAVLLDATRLFRVDVEFPPLLKEEALWSRRFRMAISPPGI
jgi:hypothetical protein